MKIGILYAGKTGTTERCAHDLKERLGEGTLINLVNETPHFYDYDLLLIGTAIRMGRIHPKVRKLIQHLEELPIKKPFAIFILHALPGVQQVINGLPEWVQKEAIRITSFGGELNLEKQRGLSRWMTKLILKSPKFKKPSLNSDAIESFVDIIKIWIINNPCYKR